MHSIRVPLSSGRDPDEGPELGTGNIPYTADADADMLHMGGQCMIVLRILIWILMASILVMLITFSVLVTVYMINHRDVVYKEEEDDQETAAERKR